MNSLHHVERTLSSIAGYLSYSFSSRFLVVSSPCTPRVLLLIFSLLTMEGCASQLSHYDQLYTSLHQGDSAKADQIIAAAEPRYGSKSKLLYLMDRGMTLHLAGRYKESTKFLEQANEMVEDLYTRRLRDEALSFLVNDTKRPFSGDPYEQVLINVINALNYARLGNLEEALVEARRIDHRLNVLADTVDGEDYQEDPFARYLTGVLYEVNGDLSNAFVGYRKAFEAYQRAQAWSEVPVPHIVKQDLLRITERLNLVNEHAEYRQAFPDVPWQPRPRNGQAEVIVISYHGRSPRLEDQFIDVPVSLDALAVLLHTKQLGRHQPQRAGGVDAVLYGLQGEIVRISLPRVVAQKSQVGYGRITVVQEGGRHTYQTELMNSVTAAAKKNLSDRLASVTVRAVARAALKISTAEGLGYGAGAVGKDDETRLAIQVIVSTLLKVLFITTEEADKRSWRTLPDEIHVSRFSVTPGSMTVTYQAFGRHGQSFGALVEYPMTLQPGETRFLTTYAAD
ncbi:MAG: hypothetical protein O2999_02680 [Nitrospirae bacterium]|nr:hypothetical protein [Nitrospirota bacterium]